MRSDLARPDQKPLDRILRILAVYVIPASMIIASVLAVLLLDKMYPKVSGTPVTLRVVPTSDKVALDPQTASETLLQQAASPPAPTGRQAWLMVDVPSQTTIKDYLLEIPSRHASSLICWNADTMELIGAASRRASTPDIRMATIGFNISLGQLAQAKQILCYGTFTGDGAVTANVWSMDDFHQTASRFDHGMGLLEGGLLTPAIFALLIAVIARESTYAILAAWLIANLRLGGFAIGWDTQWLGYLLPLEAMPHIRQLTAAVHYLLTTTLLIRLLRASNYNKHPRLLKMTKASALLLLALSVLPGIWFWLSTGIIATLGLIAAIFLLTRVIKQTGLTLWFWHVTSLTLAFSILIGLSGLLIFGESNDLDSLYTTILLLVSCAAMVLSMAERLRNTYSERQRLQTELVTSYAIAPIGMFTLDAQRHFVRMNPVLEHMLGFTIAQHPGSRWTDYFPDMDWNDLTVKAHANEDVEITAKKRHSSDKSQHFAIRAVVVDKMVEGSLQDISAQTEILEQLRVLAGKDPITEALNQRSIEQAVVNAMKNLDTDGPCCLVYMTVDHYKNISSLFGYTTGDALMIQTRKKISATLKPPHELGRIGSDEFAILFPGKTAKETQPIVERLANSIDSHAFTINDHTINVKVAIGLVELSHELNNAKEALFTAGRACRDALKEQLSVVTYERGSPALSEYREILYLFDQLEGGITPDGFQLYLQPILSMRKPLGPGCFEVLLRAHDSNNNRLSAGRVIAAAEDIGTITTIDRWVLETILTWLEDNQHRLSGLQLFSINISGVSLNSDAFIEHLFRLFERYKHLNKYVLIEMTEGVALQSLKRTQRIVQHMQDQGVRIALDDFGAGYTSFAYLRNLKADMIKIDGSLIQNMLADATNVAIVRTIIQLAHQLNMKCVAEWVEDADTLNALRKLGIDYVQGYIISPAVPMDVAMKSQSIYDLLTTDESRQLVDGLVKRPVNPTTN